MISYRLQRLRLENFRGYRKLDLDLSADVTIIYGRNGTGKTAIFDAIEYLLTGGLSRFARYDSDPSLYLRHVLAGSERTVARLDLQSPDHGNPWLQMEMPIGQNAFNFSSEPGGGLNSFLYQTLGEPDKLPGRQEVGVVAELIRASIMLSQDSLREFIEAEGAQRKPMLANLSGLGFFERCVDKIAQVVQTGERRRRDLSGVIAELEEDRVALTVQLAEEEQHLAAMAAVEDTGPAPVLEAVQSRFAALGGQWPSDALSVAEAAEAAQIFCHTRVRDLSQYLAQLEALNTIVPVLREQEHRRTQLLAEISTRKEAVATVRGQELGEQSALDTLRQDRNRALSTAAAIDAMFGNLRLLEDTLAADDDLAQREAQARLTWDEAKYAAGVARQGCAAAVAHANNLDVRLARLDTIVTRHALRSGKLRDLWDDLVSFNERFKSAGDLVAARAEIEQRRSDAIIKAEDVEETIVTLRHQLQRIAHTLTESAAAQGEMARLIEIARHYTISGECPLCGHNHGSIEELHAAMDHILTLGNTTNDRLREEERVKERALEHQRQRLEELRKLIVAEDRSVARVATLSRELSTDHDALASRARDLAITAPENDLLALAVADAERAEAESKAERQSLGAERASFASVRSEIEARLAHAERVETVAQTTLSNFSGQRTENSASCTRLLNALPDINRTSAVELRNALAVLVETREHERQQALTRAENLSAQIIERESLQRQFAERRQIIGREVVARELESAQCALRVVEYVERLNGLDVAPEAAESTVTRRITDLRAKRNEANAVAVLLGQVEREARRSSIRERRIHSEKELLALMTLIHGREVESQRITNAIAQARGWHEQLQPALDGGVALQLEQHRREAFRLFKSLVPDAHQFTDVEVLPSAMQDAINLSLCFRGTGGGGSGEPRFFLSGAQSNALALSYFLSFARRQQWCRLRTLLLDDPVQHLDDLDAVALLDLLREVALVRESATQRQMVLSTCDLNLYHLALRKFMALDPDKVSLRAYTIVDGNGDRSPKAVPDWPRERRDSLAA